MPLFSDKIIVITGASSGIGRALAESALKKGARVALCARNLEKLKAAFPGADMERVLLFGADVSKEEDSRNFIAEAIKKWGRVDVLVNNAGISMRALFEEADLDVIREVMDINFWGSVYCTKYAVSSIREHKGVIVSVSSIAGYRGLPGRTGYSASKFALQGFMEALRTELLETGAHVMWVSPGFTSSNIRNTALSADGRSQKETPLKESELMSAEECAERILDAVAKRKRTVVMTGQGKLTVFLNKFLPGLTDRLVFNHFRKEPGSPLLKYANGKP
jgi:short-subunit dehydrogenase